MSEASPQEIRRAVEILRAGGLVAFPTETVYGLGADATNADAMASIFTAKGRPSGNPLIVHVADAGLARRSSAAWPDVAQMLAERFWPGPLTLVVPRAKEIAPIATAGLGTMGVRCPDHPVALRLLREFDGPVAAPSANRSNRISPTTAEHVRRELGGKVGMILDGGPCRVGIESTVVDVTSENPLILRLGAVSREQIERLIGNVAIKTGHTEITESASSPGQQPVHYSPATPAFRFDEAEVNAITMLRRNELGRRQIFLTIAGTTLDRQIREVTEPKEVLEMPSEPNEYARKLYAMLHQADDSGAERIWVQQPPNQPEWAAINDRILRATRPATEAM
jgi:L-threonylcarbamoyladenylate synthase